LPRDVPETTSEQPVALPVEAQIEEHPQHEDSQTAEDAPNQEDTQPADDIPIPAETQASEGSLEQDDTPLVAETKAVADADAEPAPETSTDIPGNAVEEAPTGDETLGPEDPSASAEQPVSASPDAVVDVPDATQDQADEPGHEKPEESPPPPPPAPDPPIESPESLVAPVDNVQDVLDDPVAPTSPQVDKRVSFAPDTPEPAPTIRKKKSLTGKVKKKKQTGNHAKLAPDDIVAIVDEGSAQPTEANPPPPDDIVPIVDQESVQPLLVKSTTPPPPPPPEQLDEPAPCPDPVTASDEALPESDNNPAEEPTSAADHVQPKDEPMDIDTAETSEVTDVPSSDPAFDDELASTPTTELSAGPETEHPSPAQDENDEKPERLSVKARVAMFEKPLADASEIEKAIELPSVPDPAISDETTATEPEDGFKAAELETLVDEPAKTQEDDSSMAHTQPQEAPVAPLQQDDKEEENPAESTAQEAQPGTAAPEQMPDQPHPLEEQGDALESTPNATTDVAAAKIEASEKEPESGTTELASEPSGPPKGSGEGALQETSTTTASDSAAGAEDPAIEAENAPENEAKDVPEEGGTEVVADQPSSLHDDDGGQPQEDQASATEAEKVIDGPEEPVVETAADPFAMGPDADATNAMEGRQGADVVDDVAPGPQLDNVESKADDTATQPAEPAVVDTVIPQEEASSEPSAATEEEGAAKKDEVSKALLDVDPIQAATQTPAPKEEQDDAKGVEPTAPEPQAEVVEDSPPASGAEAAVRQPGPEDPPAPKLDDATQSDTILEEGPKPEPAAPPSPALSKDSSRRKQGGWTRQHKASADVSKANDNVDSKKSHRSSRTDSGAREERHRSRRYSMTAEEEAERRQRRRARKVEEEAERAEEDRQKKLRREIEKASLKAATKAAAEEARKLVREKDEDKKRRRRRDSVVKESESVPLRKIDPEQTVEIGSPKLQRPIIPKVLTDTNGESFTRAGLLVRTSSDAHRASVESPRRPRRETQPTSSPLLYEVSGSGKVERTRRAHRSGDKPRDRSDLPSTSRDAGTEGSSSRHPSRRQADNITPEEQRERPHRSRRESERRERRPSVKEKEKKSSFFGSIMKAFK
jgi:hypothetical protein